MRILLHTLLYLCLSCNLIVANNTDSVGLMLSSHSHQLENIGSITTNTQSGYIDANLYDGQEGRQLSKSENSTNSTQHKQSAQWSVSCSGFLDCIYCQIASLVGLLSFLFFGFNRRKKMKLSEEIISDNKQLRIKNTQLKSEKLEMKSINTSLQAELSALNEKLNEPEFLKEGTITLSNRNKTVLKFGDIIYIKACQNGVQIVTTSEKFIYWKGIGKFIKDLPALLFVQTHRSYIVNKAHVKAIQSDQLRMSNNDAVRVGKDYKEKTVAKIKGV